MKLISHLFWILFGLLWWSWWDPFLESCHSSMAQMAVRSLPKQTLSNLNGFLSNALEKTTIKKKGSIMLYSVFRLHLYPLSFWWAFIPIYHFHTYDCFLMGARLTRGNSPVKKLPFENTWQLWIKLELHLWATVRKRTKKSSIPSRFKFGSSGYEPAAEPCYLLRSKLMSITQS